MWSASPPLLRWTRVAAAAIVLIALPAAAPAQYFGVNKVQYKSLHFRILKTQHFDIYFHQDEREPVEMAGRLAERWWARLSQIFATEPHGRQPLLLYASHVAFEQTLVVPDLIDPGTGGFTEPWRRRIVLPFAGALADTDHVIGHELVHAFQFDIMANQGPQAGAGGGANLPLWFIEGMAEYLTRGAEDAHTAMWIRDAALDNELPSIARLDDRRYFPYRWGQAFWAYVAGRWGDHVVAELLSAAAASGVTAALDTVLGMTEDALTKDWHTAIRAAYAPSRESTQAVGSILLAGRAFGGSTNISPAISPDGRWIAFLSERSYFSIDLFVADANTGAVVGKLTDTASSPHYSNLQFIDSAAAWDRDSHRLAVGTVTSGRAALSVFGWPGGKRQLEVAIADVDEIYNPTWAPDGRSIAFSAIAGGVTDLFVFDLETRALRRLTHDAFADLQPAWAPEGRQIAFVTDRFTTDEARATFGPLQLAIINADTGRIQRVPAFASGKHISPQWAPDGSSLYFISDSDGTSNLYRVELFSGALHRMTTAATGLSGIAASSPALSVAQTGVAAVSVYEHGRFAIHTLTPAAGEPIDAAAVPPPPELPSVETPQRRVPARWLGEAPAPAAEESWRVSRYRPRLALENIATVSLGVGVDRFGAAMGGAIGVVMSDVLNTHWLVTALQLSQGLEEGISLAQTAGYVGYFNQVHRWNWGVVGSSLPTLGGIFADVAPQDTPAVLAPVTLIRQTERAASAVAAYPLNRARRVEFQGGLSRLTFDREVIAVDGQTGWTEAARPLVLGNASIAFVSDTASPGAASMVRGERYRLEMAPAFGTINYVNVTADYRRYVMPAPFYTIAARALHFGRYGSGAEDPRIPPLYLGYPTLVRGYDLNARITNECVAVLSRGCSDIERMLGSRVAVGNVEFRFPLLRPFGASSQMYGPLPVEVALFVDGGLAWRKGDFSSWSSPSGSAWSTGVTLRTSLLGFGLGQFDIARPFQRPGAGWVVQFNLAPAF